MREPNSLTEKELDSVLSFHARDAQRSRRTRIDNLNSAAAAVEMHVSVDQRVEREIAPLTNPSARVKAVADLADKNVAGSYLLTTESLHPQAL